MSAMKKSAELTQQKYKQYSEVVERELLAATAAYGPMNSPHEGYGIIKEEIDEFWDEVKRNNLTDARKEIIQVAAMCHRFLQDSEHWS